MNKLIFPVFLISVTISAQAKKELKQLTPQMDTLNRYQNQNPDKNTVRPMDQQKNLYAMPCAKPKDSGRYSGLKDSRTDNGKYKILNSMTPEAPQKEKINTKPLPGNK